MSVAQRVEDHAHFEHAKNVHSVRVTLHERIARVEATYRQRGRRNGHGLGA